MEIVIIAFASFAASLLTFLSGFGLGTLLLPVFTFFFSIEISVALTGVVHFITNITKAFLTGRYASKEIVIRFGIPSIPASFAGAWLLTRLGDLPSILEYQAGGRIYTITPVKLVIAFLLMAFTLAEFTALFNRFRLNRKLLSVGGFASGFFGGLSGMQGAIRGAFLVKANLTATAYVATAAVIACMVDLSRLPVYWLQFSDSGLADRFPLILVASVFAIAGAFGGKILLKQVTFDLIRKMVVVMLIIISIGLGTGLI